MSLLYFRAYQCPVLQSVKMKTQAQLQKPPPYYANGHHPDNTKYFMIDICAAEADAIQDVFSDIAVYICDFHRIEAW